MLQVVIITVALTGAIALFAWWFVGVVSRWTDVEDFDERNKL